MKKAIFLGLFLLAFLERVYFDLGPNFELITSAIILSSYYLSKKNTIWLVIAIMVLSDLLIGNSHIFLFTWTGFLIPAFLIKNVFKKIKTNKILLGAGLGITTNLFFFLWTNFGVWFLDSWNMYPDNLSGLALSYINGLPFLKNQLTSTIVSIPLGFLAIETVKAINHKFKLLPRLEKQELV